MAESKEDKERRGRDGLEKAIRDEAYKNGVNISSETVEKKIRTVQEYADRTGMIK